MSGIIVLYYYNKIHIVNKYMYKIKFTLYKIIFITIFYDNPIMFIKYSHENIFIFLSTDTFIGHFQNWCIPFRRKYHINISNNEFSRSPTFTYHHSSSSRLSHISQVQAMNGHLWLEILMHYSVEESTAIRNSLLHIFNIQAACHMKHKLQTHNHWHNLLVDCQTKKQYILL